MQAGRQLSFTSHDGTAGIDSVLSAKRSQPQPPSGNHHQCLTHSTSSTDTTTRKLEMEKRFQPET